MPSISWRRGAGGAMIYTVIEAVKGTLYLLIFRVANRVNSASGYSICPERCVMEATQASQVSALVYQCRFYVISHSRRIATLPVMVKVCCGINNDAGRFLFCSVSLTVP
jgi:hypothetical protein